MKRKSKFKFAAETDLCAAFMVWARTRGWVCYPETCGWDILLVDKDGIQTGVQAKLRLSAHVIAQASPGLYDHRDIGPTYRSILVPEIGELGFVARRLGLIVFHVDTYQPPMPNREQGPCVLEFEPDVRNADYSHTWFDWHPREQHDLPDVVPGGPAGIPSPSQLTPWKIGALRVIAVLERQGYITRQQIIKQKIDPGRWLYGGWLRRGDTKGQWVRSESCPAFEKQHPEMYASIAAKIAEAPQGALL